MTERQTTSGAAAVQSPLFLNESTSYGVVLGLLIAAAATGIVAPATGLTFATVIGLEGAAVLIARSTTRPKRRGLWPVLVGLVVLAVVVGAIPGAASNIAASLLDVLVLLALPAIIVARFRRELFVTVQSIFGAVSIYLVMGLLYGVIDPASSQLTGEPFFSQAATGGTSDYTYFSFITLCTVGYGDLTPASHLARALAVSEALLGQLYLVTVISLVVANLGHARQGAAASSSPAPDAMR